MCLAFARIWTREQVFTMFSNSERLAHQVSCSYVEIRWHVQMMILQILLKAHAIAKTCQAVQLAKLSSGS